MNVRRSAALLLAATAAILLLAACSLAGDVTPPPGGGAPVGQPGGPAQGQQPVDLGPGYPTARPSAAQGAAVYTEHCAQCHGATGEGNGQLAAQLQFPPANFTDPALSRNATPAQWYTLVSQGNLERFMPPFGSTLSETERWDAVFYLFTLANAPDVVQSGQESYQANCAGCHGETGQGDGPDAPAGSALPDFTDEQLMAGLTQADLFTAISGGAGQEMHAASAALPEDERWALAAYVRAFSFDAAPASPVPATAEAVTAQGTVTGQVTNGTLNVPVTGSLNVILYGFDNFQLTTTLTETIQSDGSFVFTEVPYAPGRSFVATTEYAGVTYGTDILSFENGVTQLNTTLKVYETTTDPAALHIDRMHIFFDFPGGSLTVGELYLLSNTGDKTVLGGQALQFELPPGATDLRIDGLTAGDQYIETPTGFTLTRPVPPGPNAAQLLVSFSLPYDRGLDFAQRLPFAVSTLNVLVPDTGIRLTGDQLRADGPQDVQGLRFLSFSAENMPAGQMLSFQLSGRVASANSPVAVSSSGWIVGLAALALVLGGVGWWYYSSKQAAVPAPAARPERRAQPEEPADLLQQIADLDDAYDAGRLARADYERRRNALKSKLIQEWKP